MIETILNNIPEKILSLKDKEKVNSSLQSHEPDYSIRLNPAKLNSRLNLDTVEWCDYSYYVNQKPRFSMDPLWHAGAYYVQEAGSMFLSTLVKSIPFKHEPELVLDMCASPGGKSTLLADVLPPSTILVANEVMPKRLGSLVENITKWGKSGIVVTHNQPVSFSKAGEIFDLVVVDAPCSGEGLIRRTDEALAQWSNQLIEECSIRQKEILTHAVNSLHPGGYLIYSTCTYNIKENEDNISWLVNNHDCIPVDFDVPVFNNITVTETDGVKAYRFFPGITRSEGFFITILQKKNTPTYKKTLKEGKYKQVKNPSAEMLKHKPGFIFIEEEKEQIKLVSLQLAKYQFDLNRKFNVVVMGTPVGTLKHWKFIPHEMLHFTTDLLISPEYISQIDYATAVQFLCKNNIPAFPDKKGYGFLSFENTMIGLVNHLGNRLNNCYPPNWRILRPEPEQPFSVSNLIA